MDQKHKSVPLLFLLGVFSLSTHAVMAQPQGFEPSDFKERREKLAALISDGVAILANLPSRPEARGNPEFYYLTGVDVPDAKLILVPGQIAASSHHPEFWKTTLYLPPKDPRYGVWDDPELYPGQEAETRTGIENTADFQDFLSHVARLGTITDTIYLSYPTDIRSPDQPPPALRFVEEVRRILPNARIKNLSPVLDDLRWKKSPREIAVMRKACEITVEAFKEAARFARPGIYEYEVEAIVNYIFRKNGSSRPAFLIIASGPNSCILHHMRNDRRMEDGELVKIDIGTVYESMSSDLTRTLPVSGRFTPEQREIYSIVLRAQKAAISIVRPGVTLADVHKAAYEVIDQAGYGKYFIHGASHTLNGGSDSRPTTQGLRIEGRYGQYEMSREYLADNPLAPGSMFTIEPGIYIPDKSLGIRIEDDILVTEDGHEVLTSNAPKEIEEIEELMQQSTLHVK